MSYGPTTDAKFLGTLRSWMDAQHEILLMIRYSHSAGAKRFQFFTTFESLAKAMNQPPRTCIIAFRERQLPIRGVVDDDFIARSLQAIPDGAEYLVVELAARQYGRVSVFRDDSGESHAELRDDLEYSRGHSVAVGLYPPWVEDSADVISAVVPGEDGVVTTGVY